MSPAVLLYAIQLLNALPGLIATGQNLLTVVQQHRDALERMHAENRDPTQEEWDALNASINALRSQLHS
jgi:hypothetical protein